MVLSRPQVAAVCFLILLLVGIGFMSIGLLIEPNGHHLQLDVVLTEEELADKSKYMHSFAYQLTAFLIDDFRERNRE